MSTTISIPKRLYEEAKKRGLDIETRIVEFLARELGLDPREEASLHLGLAERFLHEALSLLEKNDTVQASEKLYKAAEEAIKAMAEALGLPEAEEARKRNKWSMRLLDSAARRLAREINERIYDDWDHAYFLHTEGFHEARLDKNQVKARVKYIKELLEIAKEIMSQRKQPR